MLKPDYFNGKEKTLLALYQKLEDFILKDIARRLLQAGQMTGTADRLIWKLQQMGKSQEAIMEQLQKLTGKTQAELKRILQDAVMTSWKDDTATLKQLGIEVSSPLENSAVRAVMDAQYKKTQGELSNLTRTTMNQAQQDLINLLDKADMRVSSGIQNYNAAINDVLDEYAGRGIMVNYPSGARRTLESAVRCCVVTGCNQTSAQITNQYIKETQSEYVIVSAHLGARVGRPGQPPLADHSGWQGKVYRIRGSEPGYPNLLESTGYDIDPETGVGTVVDPLGLHGYNCAHSHRMWSKGLRNPYMDEHGNILDGNGNIISEERNRERYELSQKQRAIERSIRKTKRQLIVKQEEINATSGADRDRLQAEYDRMAYRLTEQNRKYNEFCKENDMQAQYDRNKVADFGIPQTKAANKGAKRYMSEMEEEDSAEDSPETETESLENEGDSDIITAGSIFVNKNEKLYRFAKNVTPLDGYEDIVCHADPDSFQIDIVGEGNEEDFISIKPDEFAEMIKNSTGYHGGNIRLISCQTGAKSDGAAQKVANCLGVDVYAPTETVYINQGGEIFLTNSEPLAAMWQIGEQVNETGKWILFHPGGEK